MRDRFLWSVAKLGALDRLIAQNKPTAERGSERQGP